jgi:RNA polymerase sigma-70 factor (ECF subfamily)
VEQTDIELIKAAREDIAGFKPLYQKWVSPVYRYFLHRVNNIKEAEDLTSQVFLKVIERLPTYRGKGTFPAWLFTIAHHQRVDHLRSGQDVLPLEDIKTGFHTDDLLEHAIKADEHAKLRGLIQTLPESEQELIRLRFVAMLSYKEIALVMKRKPDAVRKKIFRLLKKFEDQLEDNYV